MPHVVTESCVNHKYQDCVAVCPVDAFREMPTYLVIDPDECIDCGACINELVDQTTSALNGRPVKCENFPHQMAFNVSFDWPFADNDYTEEEMKMVHETHKIFEDDLCIAFNDISAQAPIHY